MERIEDEGSLWGLLAASQTADVLDALDRAVPEWFDEFEIRVRERFEAMAVVTRFEIKDATRDIKNVIIGLCGAPGGGKTCSALRLATGLAGDGDIVLIDTEWGKSTEFAPRPGEVIGESFDPELPLFKFKTIKLKPPFSPERYKQAVQSAATIKPTVLIIDNMTDEWNGEGGQLSMKENPPLSDPYGWKEPKGQHRALMNTLRAKPWYVILTIRAHEKQRPPTAEEKRNGASKSFINEGWLPQCDGGLPFDCTTMFQLVDNGVPVGVGRPWKIAAGLRGILKPGEPLDEEAGRRIKNWCQPVGDWKTGE